LAERISSGGKAYALLLHRLKGDLMNEDILKGKWRQIKGEVKSRWGKLTDDDVDRVEGDAEKLIGRVQERYGYQREEAQREVDDFFRGHKDMP
jgi:uncharacterized protein YjbJ (UPF0337 family)